METQSDDEPVQSHVQEYGDVETNHSWTICGFEAFDLIVMSVQALFFVFSVPLNPILSNPGFQFVVGVGFFVTMILLSRTRIYAQGVQQIKSEHDHLWSVIFVAGRCWA